MTETYFKRVMKLQHLLIAVIPTTQPSLCCHMTLKMSNVIQFSKIMLFL